MMSKIRVGIIGAGWWATANHIPLLKQRDDVELVGVCRLGADLLQQIKETFDFPFATEDYRELLAQDLDAVVVTTPHYLHYEHAKAALERGLHVMCEKPMTLNPAQAWELVTLAQSRDRHILIPYGWHYKPFIQEAKRWMEDDAVGEIDYVLCHMASPTKDFFGTTTEAVPERWTTTLASPDPATWRVKENGGGYAHGQVTHASALMFWLTGLRAAEVSARITSPDAPVDMFNAANVVFDSGAIGVISGAGTLPNQDKFQVDVRIFGKKGVLLLDVERERLALRRHDGQHRVLEIPADEGAYSCDGPPNRFIEVVQGQGRNDSPGEIGARAVELICAMFESAAQGGKPASVHT